MTTATLPLHYYVKSSSQALFSSANLSEMNGNTGLGDGITEPISSKKLWFLQQVFNRVNSDIENNSIETKAKVTVNVWLDAGDHFLFACN